MKRTSILLLLSLLISVCAAACSTTTPASSTDAASSTTEFSGTKLNLNTVTKDELLANIPGFTSRMVREFQEYRPYASIQQFRKEIGKYVGDAQVTEFEKYVYVPISINDSDSETLQQIPGLDSTEAATLMAGRPYASTEEFITKLTGFISADELDIAKTYLGE